MIQFDVLTLFPEIFTSPLEESIMLKAREAGLVMVRLFNLRDWAEDSHKTVDDTVFGGGDGMVMKPDILEKAVLAVRSEGKPAPVLLMSPQGKKFNQEWAQSLAKLERIILVCGRYAGIDQRAINRLIDEELSIGDYVLSGGEIPALAVMESVSRLVPGVLGNQDSAACDSFPQRLEFNQFTRPRIFLDEEPPQVLLSGDHRKIQEQRQKESLRKTLLRRPDLLLSYPPDENEERILREIKKELVQN
jgi:tRNA (guanine37-N1)-methyltransferase